MIPSKLRSARRFAGALAILIGIAAEAPAQTNPYYGQRISDIVYEGVLTVDTSLVRRVSGFELGATLNSGMVQEAIRQLYALSLFEHIQIEADRATRGVTVTIRVKEYPRLRSVSYQGRRKVKEGDLKEKVTLVQNQIVSSDQIRQAERAIYAVYKEKGYFFAKVANRIDERDDRGVDLTFVIDEGEKVKVKRVTILGAEEVEAGDVRGQMENKADNWLRSGKYKPDEYPEDLKKIVAYYKKEGYLDAAVLDDTVFVNDSIGGLEIQIRVHEGRRYYFGHTEFSGATLFSQIQLFRQVRYTPGEVYSEKKFQETVEGLYYLLQEQGRLFGQVQDEQVPRDSFVDISFKITENEPARIRYVHVTGNDKTKEKVIRRELSLMPGNIYRRSDLEKSMRDLMVLNYFENVVPDLQVLPNGDVDVEINVAEKSTGQISVGGGYGGQDGFVGTVGFAVPNFLGNGQSVSVNAEKGGRRASLDLSFTEPWFRDTRTSVGLDFFILSRRSFDNNYNEDRTGIGVRVGRRLRWPDRFWSVYLRGRLQDVGYSDFNAIYRANYQPGSTAGPDPDDRWPQRLTSITLTLIRDSRNRAQFATDGMRFSISAEHAGEAVGGYWHYHKELIDFVKIFPVYKEIALAFKARWGFISPTVSSDLVPYSEKFQVGGTNGDGMVRGYEEGTAGSRIVRGEVVPPEYDPDRPGDWNLIQPGTPFVQYDRSSSMTIYSLELQLPIAPPSIYGLIFADAGRGFSTSSGWRFTDGLWRSLGFGGRMVVPGVGTIGFDLAYGFDDDRVGGWRPHFQIGRGF